MRSGVVFDVACYYCSSYYRRSVPENDRLREVSVEWCGSVIDSFAVLVMACRHEKANQNDSFHIYSREHWSRECGNHPTPDTAMIAAS